VTTTPTCDTTNNWNDDGTTGCTLNCSCKIWVATATGTGIACFSTSNGTITFLEAVNQSSVPSGGGGGPGGIGLTFPHGFFSFNITGLTPGQNVTLTITLPSDMEVGTQYWKYGPACPNTVEQWYTILIGSDDGDNVITINLTDGGLGDNNCTPDGVISDPGGPGFGVPVSIFVAPSDKTVSVNQTFNITVNISGTDIIGAGFDLMFNNTILEALNIYEGSFIGQCANTTYPVPSPVINNTAGNVSFQDMCWGGETISGTGNAAVITFKALTEGISNLSLDNADVFDSEGNAITGVVVENGSVEVVSNIPPEAEPGMDKTAYTNQVLQFNGSNSTDSDGNIISYFWDFGDTNNAAGVALTHTYTSPGTYTVNLTVTDDDGAEDSDILTVTVYLAGDVNHDGCVNIYDLAKIAVAGDSATGDSRFNPDADFNNDGMIDFDDLALLAANWKKCV